MAISILSIGNSFSQDAQRYIHYLAKSEGVDIQTTNLVIGGCSLERHFRNIMGDKKEYVLGINGTETGFFTTVKEALLTKDWDYVTIQQASHFSFDYETYQPYASVLVDYIKKYCPKAKILVHQTWGYETGSERALKFGFETYEQMFAKIKESYANLAKDIGADGIIPDGEVLGTAQKLGMEKVHRDGFHAGFGAGRFMLALTWYKYLTGNSIDNVTFNMFDEPVSDAEYRIAIAAVNEVLK